MSVSRCWEYTAVVAKWVVAMQHWCAGSDSCSDPGPASCSVVQQYVLESQYHITSMVCLQVNLSCLGFWTSRWLLGSGPVSPEQLPLFLRLSLLSFSKLVISWISSISYSTSSKASCFPLQSFRWVILCVLSGQGCINFASAVYINHSHCNSSQNVNCHVRRATLHACHLKMLKCNLAILECWPFMLRHSMDTAKWYADMQTMAFRTKALSWSLLCRPPDVLFAGGLHDVTSTDNGEDVYFIKAAASCNLDLGGINTCHQCLHGCLCHRRFVWQHVVGWHVLCCMWSLLLLFCSLPMYRAWQVLRCDWMA